LSLFCIFPANFILKDDMDTFFEFDLVYVVNLVCWESLVQVCPFSANSLIEGMLNYLNIYFTSFLFNGWFLTKPAVWPFRIFEYVLPLKWACESLAYWGFVKVSFDGATNCPVSAICPRGFQCSGLSATQRCFGAEGPQVLRTLGGLFATISANNRTDRNLAILLAFIGCMKVLNVLGMVAKMRTASISFPT